MLDILWFPRFNILIYLNKQGSFYYQAVDCFQKEYSPETLQSIKQIIASTDLKIGSIMDKLILLAFVVCAFVATCESFAKDPDANGRYHFLNHKDFNFSEMHIST